MSENPDVNPVGRLRAGLTTAAAIDIVPRRGTKDCCYRNGRIVTKACQRSGIKMTLFWSRFNIQAVVWFA